MLILSYYRTKKKFFHKFFQKFFPAYLLNNRELVWRKCNERKKVPQKIWERGEKVWIYSDIKSSLFWILRKRVEKGKGIINTALSTTTVNNKYHEVNTKSLDRAVTWNQFVSIHHPELSRYRKSKMTILKFAEEFTRLIIRYTRIPSPKVSIRSIKNHS